MKKLVLLVFVLMATTTVRAQNPIAQSLMLVDCPTAGTLDRGSFMTSLHSYNNGGLLGIVQVGLSDRIMFGISYGGTNIIGTGPVTWNPKIAVNGRYRVVDETEGLPAFSIGYEGQGRGVFSDSLNRYLEKSKGIYVVGSKSFKFLGFLALHGGLNYSFEYDDGDKDLDGYVGLEKGINEELSLYAEYDLAMNDNSGRSIGDGKGYLNAGFRWSFQGKLLIDFVWKNILKNNKNRPYSSREIRLNYVEYF